MAKTKTLSQIYAEHAKNVNITKAEAKRCGEAWAKLIVKELKTNGEFNLFGLGKIVIKTSKARDGINPMTRKTIHIPAKKRIKFRAGKCLKEIVNKK